MNLDNPEIDNTNGSDQYFSPKSDKSDDITDPPDELLEAVKQWLNETFDRSIYSLETLKKRLLLYQSSQFKQLLRTIKIDCTKKFWK